MKHEIYYDRDAHFNHLSKLTSAKFDKTIDLCQNTSILNSRNAGLFALPPDQFLMIIGKKDVCEEIIIMPLHLSNFHLIGEI